jgi:hypothetical protein
MEQTLNDMLEVVHQQQFGDWAEANTPDGLIPDSWVDDAGIRHAVIWDLSDKQTMRIELRDGSWEIINDLPF